jgi:hypothetical protein
MGERLRGQWAKIANDLNLDVSFNYNIKTVNGSNLFIDVYLKNFGGKRGMLLDSNPDLFEDLLKLSDDKYGFSILNEPIDQSEEYDRSACIEMLSEWGWTGPKDRKPLWLMEILAEIEVGLLKQNPENEIFSEQFINTSGVEKIQLVKYQNRNGYYLIFNNQFCDRVVEIKYESIDAAISESQKVFCIYPDEWEYFEQID